ncbi:MULTISPECIES: fasciclin domain-containing protein [Haloarcula]|uniref:fasciclin domain-containing protein n=1 Tax=Haloarcula TaxID=2237 RepID=UPI0023EB7ADD|nr:fasciclin domain-containing protein [Halomicroarcula sp. XH51]
MNRRNVLKAVGGAGILLTTGVGTAAARGKGRREGASADGTILDIVEESPDFSSLEAALNATGLAGVLDGNRQYTVFAPDNEAFGELIATLDSVLDDDIEDLDDVVGALGADGVTEVLLYHVTNGRRYSESVVNASKIKMETGGTVDVDGLGLNGGGDELGGATIEAPDTEASNGVVHRIDSVLVPPEILATL